VPAAAVIPAPIVYTNVAAVKTLVVDCRVTGAASDHFGGHQGSGNASYSPDAESVSWLELSSLTVSSSICTTVMLWLSKESVR